MKKLTLGRVIAAAVVIAVVGFALYSFRFVEEEEKIGPTGQACSNRFHAAQRMLSELGTPMKKVARLSAQDALPPAGTVILQAGVSITSKQWQSLLSWIDSGGHLVVEVEGSDLTSRFTRAAQNCDVGGWFSGDTHLVLEAFDVHQDEESVAPVDAVKIEMEAGREPVEVKFGPHANLYTEDSEPDWAAPSADAAQVFEFLSGQGRVTIVSSLQFADNWHIGDAQNAAFLWGLLAVSHRSPSAVWFVQYTDRPSFLLWLWENGRAPILAGALFVALWIWYLMPRFGPIEPELSADRRSLIEHLRAAGRLAFRRQAADPLLLQARNQCKVLLSRHAPGADVSQPERMARLGAEMTGMSGDALLEALTRSPANAREITHMAATLAEFRRRLSSFSQSKEQK